MDKKIKALWEVTENEEIEVRYTNLHHSDPKLDGLYLWVYDFPIILLDESLQWRRQQFRCVFAEEMGHYYTVAKSNFLITQPSYSDKLNLSRDEYRAMCWATDYLIPDSELIYAIKSLRIKSCFDLASYFEVTNTFFIHKLENLKRRNKINDFIDNIIDIEYLKVNI